MAKDPQHERKLTPPDDDSDRYNRTIDPARQNNQGNQGRQSGAPGKFIGVDDGRRVGQKPGSTGGLHEQQRQGSVAPREGPETKSEPEAEPRRGAE